jgi:hypothetical protein
MCFSYVFDELCCFYAAAMLLVLLCLFCFCVFMAAWVWCGIFYVCSGSRARNINSCISMDSLNINKLYVGYLLL